MIFFRCECCSQTNNARSYTVKNTNRQNHKQKCSPDGVGMLCNTVAHRFIKRNPPNDVP